MYLQHDPQRINGDITRKVSDPTSQHEHSHYDFGSVRDGPLLLTRERIEESKTHFEQDETSEVSHERVEFG